MIAVIQKPPWKAVVVFLAVALWLTSGSLFDHHDPWQRIGWHVTGGFLFFALGLILPEYPKLCFLSRESALRLMALFVFLTVTELTRLFSGSLASNPFLNLAAIVGAPLLSYFGALFLIRGLRAAPQYPVTAPQETPPGEHPPDQPG